MVNDKKLFIGISGKMGTGKSTVTKLLLDAIPNSGRVSMASPIYAVQDVIYDKLNLKLKGDKDRALLIAIGKWGRDISPDFWLGQAVRSALDSSNDIVICDDVRFPNEADFFSKSGILIRLEGDQRGDNVDVSKSNDITETALDDYKFENVLHNSLTPVEICQEIAKIMIGG